MGRRTLALLFALGERSLDLVVDELVLVCERFGAALDLGVRLCRGVEWLAALETGPGVTRGLAPLPAPFAVPVEAAPAAAAPPAAPAPPAPAFEAPRLLFPTFWLAILARRSLREVLS